MLREAVEDLEWAAAPVTVELQREPPCLTFVARSDVAGDVKVRRIPCMHLPLLRLTPHPALQVALDAGLTSPAVQSFECVGDRQSSRCVASRLVVHASQPRFDPCASHPRFTYKFLRTAACMPHALTSPAGGGSGTGRGQETLSEGSLSRVQLDGQGMLKVQHLLHLAPKGTHGAAPSTVYMHMQPGEPTLEVPDPTPTMPSGQQYPQHQRHHAARPGGGHAGGGGHITLVTFILFPQEAEADDGIANAAPPLTRQLDGASSPEL